jgi:glycerate dehydrogenase
MEVLIAQRPGSAADPARLPLPELLTRADIVSLHCPLTDLTRNLIGAEQLQSMKPDALLINTARGGLVDEEALVRALRQGIIGGAGFDVLTQEPPQNGNPLLVDDIPNLIVTPHVAWASRESRQRLVDQVAENIRSFAGGEERNLVVSV